MSDLISKPIRSPSYPNLPLREAVAAVAKIEGVYRASPVDREAGAKLIGFSSLSGPANQALAALASYGLVERAGKGEMRVTERARSILHPDSAGEKIHALSAAASEPQLYRELCERFSDIAVPPEEGVVNYLNRQGFNPTAVKPAAKAFLMTMAYMKELGGIESHGQADTFAQKSLSPLGNGTQADNGGDRGGGTDLGQTENEDGQPLRRNEGVRLMEGERVVFTEEGRPGQYLKLIASDDFDDTLLEALEDFIKRQRKRLTATASRPTHYEDIAN